MHNRNHRRRSIHLHRGRTVPLDPGGATLHAAASAVVPALMLFSLGLFLSIQAQVQARMAPEAGAILAVWAMLALGALLSGMGCFFVFVIAPESKRPPLPRRLFYSLCMVLFTGGIGLLALPGKAAGALLY
ncbi:MAG: hypothetical protein JXA20_02270 [Spirochaetes bacterium]|nr:hypothetical protein [Spirochaetota bacterium]